MSWWINGNELNGGWLLYAINTRHTKCLLLDIEIVKNLMPLDADYMQSCKRDIQVMMQPFLPDVHPSMDYCGYQTENNKVTLTLFSNTVLNHCTLTLSSNTVLKHCSETLFSNTVLKHCSQTLYSKTTALKLLWTRILVHIRWEVLWDHSKTLWSEVKTAVVAARGVTGYHLTVLADSDSPGYK